MSALLRLPAHLASVCAWCPGARAATAAAVAAGFDVTHGICPACVVKLDAELDTVQ